MSRTRTVALFDTSTQFTSTAQYDEMRHGPSASTHISFITLCDDVFQLLMPQPSHERTPVIPNSAPMAAVFRRPENRFWCLPVAAWTESSEKAAMVSTPDGRLSTVSALGESYDVRFLGIVPGTWTPTPDEMTTLLPERTPGDPDPLAVRVRLEETESGTWAACRSQDGVLLDTAGSVAALERKLIAVGGFRIEKITPYDGSGS